MACCLFTCGSWWWHLSLGVMFSNSVQVGGQTYLLSHASLHGRFLYLCVNRWMLELLSLSTYLLSWLLLRTALRVFVQVYASLCGSMFSYLLGAHKTWTALPCGTLVKVLANCQSIFARLDEAFLFPPATCGRFEFFPVLATLILSHSLQPCLWVKGQFIEALTYISLVGSDVGHLVCWLAVWMASSDSVCSDHLLLLCLGCLSLYYWVALYPHTS